MSRRSETLDLTPPTLDVAVYENGTSMVRVYLKDQETKAVIPLTGYTGAAASWSGIGGEPEEVGLEAVIEGDKIAVKISEVNKEAIQAAGPKGVWEVRAVDPEGEPRVFIIGSFEVRSGIG